MTTDTTTDEAEVLRQTLDALRAAQATAPPYSQAGLANQIRLTAKRLAALDRPKSAPVLGNDAPLGYVDALIADCAYGDRRPDRPVDSITRRMLDAGWTPPPDDLDLEGCHAWHLAELRRVAPLIGMVAVDDTVSGYLPPVAPDPADEGEPDDDEGEWDDDD